MYVPNKHNKDTVGLPMAIAMAAAHCGGAQAQTMPAESALPRLVRFSGTAKDTGGNPVTGVTGITFALYAEQIGGAPLWSETQSAQAGAGGHYTVLLGAAKSEGLQAGLFTAEQAHWVGVSVEGQALGDFPKNSLTGALEISPDGHKVMVSANDDETGYELWSLENFELPRRSSDSLLVGQTIGLCRLPTLSESGRPRKAMVCPTDENTYSFGW